MINQTKKIGKTVFTVVLFSFHLSLAPYFPSLVLPTFILKFSDYRTLISYGESNQRGENITDVCFIASYL